MADVEQIEVMFIDRQVEIQWRGKPIEHDGHRRTPYRSIQSAVDFVLQRLSVAWCLDGVGSVANALSQGRAQVLFRGELRELAVAKLYLQARYSLQTGVAFTGSGQSDSFYEAFGMGSDSMHSQQILERLDAWHRELADHPEILESATSAIEWTRRKASVLKTIRVTNGVPVPPTIAIVGAAGAGKSSFLNAVLGRDVVPTGTEITTSTIVELRFATSKTQERARIRWASHARLTAAIYKLKSELGTAKRMAAASEAAELPIRMTNRLTQLEHALEICRTVQDVPLSLLRDYIDANGTASAGVERVVVYLDHPLLRHVSLVDTPGLRDPDEWRQALALNELAKAEAWVYLASASSKITSSDLDDLRKIQEQSNNPIGSILFTKEDTVQGGSLETVISQRAASLHQHGFSFPHSSVTSAALCALNGNQANELEQAVRAFAVQTMPNESRSRVSSFASTLMDVYDQQPAHLRDFLADASGIVAGMQMVGVHTISLVMGSRCGRAQSDIISFANDARNRLSSRREHMSALISMWDSLHLMEAEFSKVEKERDAREFAARQRRSSLEMAFEAERTRAASLAGSISDPKEACLDMMRKTVADAARGELWGERTFPVFEHYDIPLAAEYGRVLKEFLSSAADRLFIAATGDPDDVRSSHYTEDVQGVCRLEGLSLHSTNQVELTDQEKLFESFASTIARLEHKARSHFGTVRRALHDATAHAAYERLDLIRSEALKLLYSEENAVAELTSSLNEMRVRIMEMRGAVTSDRDVMERRLESIHAALEAVQRFLDMMSTPDEDV